MPFPGLSLVGFMVRDHAIHHLNQACIPANNSDAALEAEWKQAAARLGNAMPKSGQPDIQDIPAKHLARAQQTLQLQWVVQAFQNLQLEVKLVEIDPLLAFQFTINTHRSTHHCAALQQPPTMEELLDLGLPLAAPNDPFDWNIQSQSMLIKSKSLNLRTHAQGLFNGAFAGVIFGPSVPLVHVVRFNGRCYLHNGFHRCYGARISGATHIPCVFRDVATAAEAGIRDDGATFNQALLESNNPPTVGHFTQGRAHGVTLRELYRVIHVSWSEYTMAND